MSPPGATYQFIMKGGGHYEYQRSADVGRARMEVTLEPSAGPGAPALAPGTSISPITTLYVFDGAHVFQQDKSGEPAVDPSAGKPKITVHRGTIDDVGPFSVSGVIGADALQPLLDKGMQLRRLPDGTVDDKPAYIIEMAGPPEANQPVGDSKQKLYYDKDTGICVKIEHFLRGDSPLVSMTFRNIEVNPAIDRARFVYTVPNEAEVREMRPPPPGGPPQ
jgi:hypothetical protein